MTDPNKAVPTWDDADVYVGGLTAANPDADEDFDEDWLQVGLLDGDAGFTKARSFDSNDRFAWGGRLFGSSKKNYKETHAFTAFENNEATASFLHPGSDIVWDGPNYTGTLKVPDLSHRFKIAFEKRYGDVVERLISVNYVTIEEFGDVTSNEEDGESYPVTIVVYPNAAKELWQTSKTGASADGSEPAPQDWFLAITGTPGGGTYTLGVSKGGGATQTTAGLAPGANSAAIKSALEALSNVDQGDVDVGAPGGGAGVVTRLLDWHTLVTMTATAAFTGGTSPTVSVTPI